MPFAPIGYAGYIQGVKSEVVFGQTYGLTSLASKGNTFHKGRDEPANLKYNTIMKSEYIDHATKSHETVAEIVGVQRSSPRFNKVRILVLTNYHFCNSQSPQSQFTLSSVSMHPPLTTLPANPALTTTKPPTATKLSLTLLQPSTVLRTNPRALSSVTPFPATPVLTAESRLITYSA